MLIRSQVDGLQNPIDDVASVSRQQRRDIDAALLQSLSRVEKIEGAFDLAVNSFIARHLGAIKASTQAINLIIDFAPAFFHRVSQRGIDAPKLLLQTIQLAIESLRRVLERC